MPDDGKLKTAYDPTGVIRISEWFLNRLYDSSQPPIWPYDVEPVDPDPGTEFDGYVTVHPKVPT